MAPAIEQQFIDYNDPKDQCCCGCTHITTGTQILAIIEIVCSILSIIFYAFSYLWFVPIAIVNLVIAVLLYYGVQKQNKCFVLAHLIFQIVGFIGSIIWFVVFGILLANRSIDMKEQLRNQYKAMGIPPKTIEEIVAGVGTASIVGGVIGALIGLAVAAWLISVVYRCYMFFRHREQQQQQGQQMTNKP